MEHIFIQMNKDFQTIFFDCNVEFKRYCTILHAVYLNTHIEAIQFKCVICMYYHWGTPDLIIGSRTQILSVSGDHPEDCQMAAS